MASPDPGGGDRRCATWLKYAVKKDGPATEPDALKHEGLWSEPKRLDRM